MFSAPILRVMMVLFTPLNFLFMQWKKLLNRIFRPRETPGITGEELLTLVEEVENEGSIGAHEGELIRAAIEFDDRSVEEILTPRVEMGGGGGGKRRRRGGRSFLQRGLLSSARFTGKRWIPLWA